MREMDRNGAHLPHAHVVAEAGSLPVAAVVTGYIENDPRCSRDAVPDAHPVRPSDTVRILVFILVVGLLLLVVALAQALLASDVKKNVSKHVSTRSLSLQLLNVYCMITMTGLATACTWKLKSLKIRSYIRPSWSNIIRSRDRMDMSFSEGARSCPPKQLQTLWRDIHMYIRRL